MRRYTMTPSYRASDPQSEVLSILRRYDLPLPKPANPGWEVYKPLEISQNFRIAVCKSLGRFNEWLKKDRPFISLENLKGVYLVILKRVLSESSCQSSSLSSLKVKKILLSFTRRKEGVTGRDILDYRMSFDAEQGSCYASFYESGENQLMRRTNQVLEEIPSHSLEGLPATEFLYRIIEKIS